MSELGRIAPEDAWNRALVESAHPPAWRNPAPKARYDLVVLGAGTAGLVAAVVSAGVGAKVALVERHLMGGDCLNFGCVPSKTLIRSARAAAAVREATRFGVRAAGPVEVDFAAVMERVRRVRAEIAPHDSAKRFSELGVDVFLGHGRFTGPQSLEVAGAELRFKRGVVATGARAAPPPIPGLADAGCHTNETIFSLVTRPERLVVIGAGPVGCELAQSFQRLGSRVTLIEVAPQVLIREDPDAAALVQAALARDGVELMLGAKLLAVERRGGAKLLRVSTAAGERTVEADEILVGVGRAPNVEDAGLEAAGIAYDRSGVKVDPRLRTTNPRVFAAGDVCLATKFTHAADAAAKLVVRNAFFFGRRRAADLRIPWCTYTDPEVAHVGLYPRDAESAGIALDTFQTPLAGNDRSRAEGEEAGFLKVHVKKGSDSIVGATIVARHAGDLIAPLAVAMASGAGLGKLVDLVLPYPTQSELLKVVAGAYTRTRLTPFAARALRTLIGLAR